MSCGKENYSPCSQGCEKKTKCTCECTKSYPKEICNECVNQEGITFDGICNSADFPVDVTTWVDLTVVGTAVVPSEKPSIEDVDKIGVKVEILSRKVIVTPDSEDTPNFEGKKVTGKKLIVQGLVCLKISYVSLTPEQSVHSFHSAIPFSTFIVLPNDANAKCGYDISACVEEVCVRRICERSVELTAAIFLKTEELRSLSSDTDMNDITDASGINCRGLDKCPTNECFTDNPDIKGVCDPLTLETLIVPTDREWTEISVPELLNIPALKPDIYQIASVNSRIEIMCQDVIKTPTAVANSEGTILTGYKLLVHALLRQRITYISTKNCGAVHSAHYDVPITAYIVLDGDEEVTNLTRKYRIKACIEDVYACPLNERQIFKSTTLFFKATPIELCSKED